MKTTTKKVLETTRKSYFFLRFMNFIVDEHNADFKGHWTSFLLLSASIHYHWPLGTSLCALWFRNMHLAQGIFKPFGIGTLTLKFMTRAGWTVNISLKLQLAIFFMTFCDSFWNFATFNWEHKYSLMMLYFRRYRSILDGDSFTDYSLATKHF